MGARESSGEGRSVPLIWIDREDEPVLFANQILAQHLNDEFLISFGQVSPPAILGSEEEREDALARVEFVPVKTGRTHWNARAADAGVRFHHAAEPRTV